MGNKLEESWDGKQHVTAKNLMRGLVRADGFLSKATIIMQNEDAFQLKVLFITISCAFQKLMGSDDFRVPRRLFDRKCLESTMFLKVAHLCLNSVIIIHWGVN